MPPSISCPNCSRALPYKPEWVGKRAHCMNCDHRFIVEAVLPPDEMPVAPSLRSQPVSPMRPPPLPKTGPEEPKVVEVECVVAKQEKDCLVRNVAIATAVITALIAAVILVPHLRRDKWESYNMGRVISRLEEADRLQKTDPLAAYKTYDEVLKEAQQHTITDETFANKLAVAEKSRATLYEKLEEEIKAEEAEKRRLAKEAEDKIKADAAEKLRREKDEAKRAEEEERRIAEQQAEEKRRREIVSVYRDAPPSARYALNALKKVEARTEVGIVYTDYLKVVGEAWGEVKIFSESPDGQELREFSLLLTKAIADYKVALRAWKLKIEFPTLKTYGSKLDELQQLCWARAGVRLRLAESLLDVEKTEKTLEAIATAQDTDEDYVAKLNRILQGG